MSQLSPGQPVVLASQGEKTSSRASSRFSILTTAFELLKEHGYANVTTEMIAASARISKGTIYQMWETKQELFVESVRTQVVPLSVPDTGSFRTDISWLLSHRLENYRQPGTLRLVADILGQSTADPHLARVFGDWVENLSRAIRQCIHRGIARDEIAPDVDGFALESLVAGIVARAVITQSAFSSETIEHVADLIERAVRE